MNTKLKKILIIIIIILIIGLAGLLVYNFFLKPDRTEEIGTGGEFPEGGESGTIPGPGEEGLAPQPEQRTKAISQEAVISPTLSSDKTQIVYYSRIDGTVWQSNFDGSNLKQISSGILDNLIDVIWAPDKGETINVFQDNLGNVSKYFYNFSTNKALPLNKYIQDINWSPESNKVAYQYHNEFTNDNNISTANPDGSGFSNILTTRMKDLIIEWPKGSELFLRERPSGLVQSSLYSLNTLSRSFAKVILEIYGFSIKWSPDGQKLLYSKTSSNGKNIKIFIANRNGSNEKSAKINTLAEKCVWSQDPRIIYCAIPKNITDANILPDDFYKGTFAANDEFWKIDIETSEKTKLLQGDEVSEIYDAIDLFLSPEESYLFFINKVNGLLYSIKL
jgi:hypothetical protein